MMIQQLIRYSMVLCFASTFLCGIEAQQLDLNFETKDFNEEIQILSERLDSTMNHVIMFTKSGCGPCERHIRDDYEQNINSYESQYNLKITIIYDRYFDSPSRLYERIHERQWYFDVFMTDWKFNDLNISAFPTYYFLPKGESSATRISYPIIDKVIKDLVEKNPEKKFDQNIKEKVLNADCEVQEYFTQSAINIKGVDYRKFGNGWYRTAALDDDMLRYTPSTQEVSTIFDFNPDICELQLLKDADGDSLFYTVEQIVETENEVLVYTDQILDNPCGEAEVFHLSSRYGSNAGINFDIQNGKIVSRLICHQMNDEQIYLDESLSISCATTNTSNQIKEPLSIQPNPVREQLVVSCDHIDELEIYDILGNRVLTQLVSASSLTIDIGHYPPGIYLLRILSNGEAITRKFMKE